MRRHFLAVAIIGIASASSLTASAQDGLRGSAAVGQPQAVRAERSEGQSPPFGMGAIDEKALGAIAGREDTTQVSQNEQFAGVTDNSVGDNSVTGDARIADNAFQNMSGLSILNVNTGNNVAINASMNVNVSISHGQ